MDSQKDSVSNIEHHGYAGSTVRMLELDAASPGERLTIVSLAWTIGIA